MNTISTAKTINRGICPLCYPTSDGPKRVKHVYYVIKLHVACYHTVCMAQKFDGGKL